MSFLRRVFVIVGLSFVMTLILMVIHWEPERPVAPAAVAPARAVLVSVTSQPAVERATESATDRSFRENEGDWEMRDVQDVAGLSTDIRAALAGCVLPRSPEFPNVVSAELKQAGQTDLAVLCVRGAHAAVYVFWGGNPAGVEIATDFDFIPGTYIRTAAAADIGVEVRRELPIEPGMPLRIRHDGIQLGNGCCATTHYWHRGRWRSYVSAD